MSSERRPGFTLIEVVIAGFIFAVGVLALEATAVTALRQMRRAATLTLAASVARARLEKLAGSDCAQLRSGTDTTRTIVSAWTVEPTASPSIRAVSQSVRYTLDGKPRTDSYRAMFPCS
ncbi:MAG: prepilin-type N-terminal cleavage/methylation domain-containing protein [Gemmatimonadaceae bacterium]